MNLSVAHSKLADFAMSNRQYDRAFEGYSRSLAIAERVLRSPRTTEYTETARKGFVARSLDSLGWVTYELGRARGGDRAVQPLPRVVRGSHGFAPR